MFHSYVNFAFGDGSLATLSGDDVARLRALKKEYDPNGRFDEIFLTLTADGFLLAYRIGFLSVTGSTLVATNAHVE